jgi:chromosome segregation ATPase
LISEQSQNENVARLIRLQQFKISQARAKIAKVQEGFEGGLYSLDDAKKRIGDHQETVAEVEGEIQRLKKAALTRRCSPPTSRLCERG